MTTILLHGNNEPGTTEIVQPFFSMATMDQTGQKHDKQSLTWQRWTAQDRNIATILLHGKDGPYRTETWQPFSYVATMDRAGQKHDNHSPTWQQWTMQDRNMTTILLHGNDGPGRIETSLYKIVDYYLFDFNYL